MLDCLITVLVLFLLTPEQPAKEEVELSEFLPSYLFWIYRQKKVDYYGRSWAHLYEMTVYFFQNYSKIRAFARFI